MKIKDSSDNNITGNLNFKGDGGAVGTWTKNTDELSLNGEGYNVGYYSQKLKCNPKGEPEEFQLNKGISAQTGGVYFYYRKFSDGINNTESLPIATVYIAPSAFMAKMGRVDQILTASAQLSKILAEDEFQAIIEPMGIALSESNSMRGQIAMLENQLNEQEERSKELDQVVQALQLGSGNNAAVYAARGYPQPYSHPSASKSSRALDRDWTPGLEGRIHSKNTGTTDAYRSIEWDYLYGDQPTKYGRLLSPSQPISNSDTDEYKKIKEREKDVQRSEIKVSTQVDTMNDLLSRVAKQKNITEEKKSLVAKLTLKSGSLIIEPGLYNLTFASGLSIPSGPATSSIYLEVSEVNKDYVKIRLQKMILEVENLTSEVN